MQANSEAHQSCCTSSDWCVQVVRAMRFLRQALRHNVLCTHVLQSALKVNFKCCPVTVAPGLKVAEWTQALYRGPDSALRPWQSLNTSELGFFSVESITAVVCAMRSTQSQVRISVTPSGH
jgi:hypothetical protein